MISAYKGKQEKNMINTYFNWWKHLKNGLVFNSPKFSIRNPQITFYSNFIAQGMKLDPAKVYASQDLPTPENQKQLQLFLGPINNLQPFLPDVASKTTFLWEKVSHWDWNPSTGAAFHWLKQWTCNTLIKITLTYFDHTKTCGNTHWHQWIWPRCSPHPSWETNCLHFQDPHQHQNQIHQCRAWMPVCLFWVRKISHICIWHTHHRTQQSQTTWNDSEETNPHSTLTYKECSNDHRSTTIQFNTSQEKKWSWQITSADSHFEEKNMWIELQQNIHNIHFTSDILNIIRGAIDRDPIHSTVYQLTLNNWPERVQEVSHITCHFWGTRDELTIENGILLKGDRVCISPELYKRTLSDLHSSCRDIGKMRHLSQANVYWPMNGSWHCWLCQSMQDLYPA